MWFEVRDDFIITFMSLLVSSCPGKLTFTTRFGRYSLLNISRKWVRIRIHESFYARHRKSITELYVWLFCNCNIHVVLQFIYTVTSYTILVPILYVTKLWYICDLQCTVKQKPIFSLNPFSSSAGTKWSTCNRSFIDLHTKTLHCCTRNRELCLISFDKQSTSGICIIE
jgi:hypothetical protein